MGVHNKVGLVYKNSYNTPYILMGEADDFATGEHFVVIKMPGHWPLHVLRRDYFEKNYFVAKTCWNCTRFSKERNTCRIDDLYRPDIGFDCCDKYEERANEGRTFLSYL